MFFVKFYGILQAILDFLHAGSLVDGQTDVKQSNRRLSTISIANAVKETPIVSDEISTYLLLSA